MNSKVVLKGLAFHARHGVYSEEAVLGARFVVDAELYYNFAGITDDLDQVVNYAEAHALIQQMVTEQRFDLIETLASHLVRELLAAQPLLTAVLVRVHKPHAPLRGMFDDVYAELYLTREEV